MTTDNPSLAEDFFSQSSRPRTRLPSYHTDYAKSSPYSTDLKKGFIPGAVTPPSNTSPQSESTLLGLSNRPPPFTFTDQGDIHSPSIEIQDSTPQSFTTPESASGAYQDPPKYKLSEELRGLLFLAPSVVVDDRPKVRRPADPDLSPTQGWTKLPDSGSSRRLA